VIGSSVQRIASIRLDGLVYFLIAMNGPHPHHDGGATSPVGEFSDSQLAALELIASGRELSDQEWEFVCAYDWGRRATPWPEPTGSEVRAQQKVTRRGRSQYASMRTLEENHPERWKNLGPGWLHELELPTGITSWERHVLREAAAHELRMLYADRRTQRKMLFRRWKVRALRELLGTNYEATDAFAGTLKSEAIELLTDARRDDQPPDNRAVSTSGPPRPRRLRTASMRTRRRGGHDGERPTDISARLSNQRRLGTERGARCAGQAGP